MTKEQRLNDIAIAVYAENGLVTPAYIYDERAILDTLGLLSGVHSTCRILYSIKAVSMAGLLETIAGHVDGFSVSSLFEARLAREILGSRGSVHMTSPGLRPDEISRLSQECDYLTFNSLSQWDRFVGEIGDHVSCGVRINPGVNFVEDDRYNPCRAFSKLGVSLPDFLRCYEQGRSSLRSISGIHIHNNCESRDYSELDATLTRVSDALCDCLPSLSWINLGGGYFVDNQSQISILSDIASRLNKRFGLDVFFEPGKAVVGATGYLVASVIDLFVSDGKTIAVLDTTINHLPEVFEYQYQPVVMQATENGTYEYRLAGASCLSGDLLGDYRFDRPLELGSRILIENIGAYMLVKANMFNGINLPSVYILGHDKSLRLLKQYDYDDYRDRL